MRNGNCFTEMLEKGLRNRKNIVIQAKQKKPQRTT